MEANVPEIVGCLCLRSSSPPKREVKYYVAANDDFDLGRRDVADDLGRDALSVSTHHLRFRCVNYEEDGHIKVAPMVYVRVLSKNTVWLSSSQQNGATSLCRDDTDVLLNNEDTLYLTDTISVQFRVEGNCGVEVPGLSKTHKRELNYFADRYQVIDRRLGAGGHASVFVAIEKRTKRQVACKVVRMPIMSALDVEALRSSLKMTEEEKTCDLQRMEQEVLKRQGELRREFDILKNICHPNIITLHKVFCASYNVYIFEELVTGGDLLSYLDMKGKLTEPQAAVIIRQILKAVEYLHENAIVHRDIKPENVLLTSWRDGARVILTDFGQARTLEGARDWERNNAVFRMQSVVGTAGYTAPEVLRQLKPGVHNDGYSKAIDIWSIGCITAHLLTGRILFEQDEIIEKVRQDDSPEKRRLPMVQDLSLDFMNTALHWRSIKRNAKLFVRQCVTVDETERLTAKQALLHLWFTNWRYAPELEAAYDRAIRDWKPRNVGQDVVEYLETSIRTGGPQLGTDMKSTYFPPQTAQECEKNRSVFRNDKPQMAAADSVDISSPENDFEEKEGVSQASTIVPYVTQTSVTQ